MENATLQNLDLCREPHSVAKRCALCGIYFQGHLDGNYLCALCCSLRGERAGEAVEETEAPEPGAGASLTAA
ncbi:MAG TPA: hypothetical protein VNF74_14865 [Terriglobales bacterium]|nr:hypothetical protein [Terriglobales bacterium]